MKILLTGGTGFIGKALGEELIQSGNEVFVLTRHKQEDKQNLQFFLWDKENLQKLINEVDIVINLAGEPIAQKRWTKKQKELLYNSRIQTTQLLVNAINQSPSKPKKLINASAVGIYGDRKDEELTENSSYGDDFLANLCKDWEAEALKAKTSVVILRTGIVLGARGGALRKMLPPFKFFLGGPLGSGNQWMPWISLFDVSGIIKLVIENNKISGALNLVSPNPVTNKEFSKILGKVLNRPSFLPAPAFALRLLLGEMSDVLLSSQRAVPHRLNQIGYEFQYTNLENAFNNILNCNVK